MRKRAARRCPAQGKDFPWSLTGFGAQAVQLLTDLTGVPDTITATLLAKSVTCTAVRRPPALAAGKPFLPFGARPQRASGATAAQLVPAHGLPATIHECRARVV